MGQEKFSKGTRVKYIGSLESLYECKGEVISKDGGVRFGGLTFVEVKWDDDGRCTYARASNLQVENCKIKSIW
jgi:hypothetical protein